MEAIVTSFESVMLGVLIASQVVSVLVLLYAAYSYWRVVQSRRHFFAVMDVTDRHYGLRVKRLLLFLYIITVIAVTFAIDLLFAFRPHIL